MKQKAKVFERKFICGTYKIGGKLDWEKEFASF